MREVLAALPLYPSAVPGSIDTYRGSQSSVTPVLGIGIEFPLPDSLGIRDTHGAHNTHTHSHTLGKILIKSKKKNKQLQD